MCGVSFVTGIGMLGLEVLRESLCECGVKLVFDMC
jgi:hypothetical protein